jgi:hypothetical protein
MKLNPKIKSYPTKIFNKNFYRFAFSFVAVVAGMLVLILIMGVGANV